MGNTITEFFRKVGQAVFSLSKTPKKLKKSIQKTKSHATNKSNPQIPSFLQGFFQKRHGDWPEYVMLKVQITILLLFGFTGIFILTSGFWKIIIPALLALSIYAIFLSKSQLKSAFGHDYPAYRSFVGICIGVAWGSALLLNYFPPTLGETLLELMLPILIVIAGIVLVFFGFRIKYGRDHTYGKVKETKKDKAKVKIGYDLRSNIKQGVYFVESYVPVKKGDIVKIKVDRSTLGLQGSAPTEIIEKTPEIKRNFSI